MWKQVREKNPQGHWSSCKRKRGWIPALVGELSIRERVSEHRSPWWCADLEFQAGVDDAGWMVPNAFQWKLGSLANVARFIKQNVFFQMRQSLQPWKISLNFFKDFMDEWMQWRNGWRKWKAS